MTLERKISKFDGLVIGCVVLVAASLILLCYKKGSAEKEHKRESIEAGLAKTRAVMNKSIDHSSTLKSVNEMPDGSMLIVYSGKTSECEIQIMRSESRKTEPWEINKLNCDKKLQ